MLKVLSHPITLLIFTIFSIIFFLSLDKTANKRQQSAETIAQLEEEVEVWQDEVNELAIATDEASSPLNRERLYRDELLMKKPGEYIVQLPDFEEAAEVEVKPSASPRPLDTWIKLFF